MDPIQALDMLGQVVKSVKLPYNEHVLLERSVDVLRKALTAASPEAAELLDTEDPVVLEDSTASVSTKSKTPRRGGRRKK
tara:strand:- start:478 stop:717 length:240 start_codon:yes stop_codon:yes gene_type:complete